MVVSYNKKTVLLVQDNGNKIKVARSRIPQYYKLKTGIRVHATFDSKNLLEKIRKQEKEKKTKN